MKTRRSEAPAARRGDEGWMRRAMALARRGVGLTSPNPAVGAVLVRGGRIIGRGWHHRAGGPHAEIVALADARRNRLPTRGATLYVTLEPCSTHGRTPPCTDAIAAAGVRRVVYGATDPNPRHLGRARRILTRRGVTVTGGVLGENCAALNRAFNRWITTGRPWVIAKIAMSADGRISPPPGRPKRITSAAALRRAHELRLWSDAIIVGAETVRSDDPALTVRLCDRARQKPQPWRVIMTHSGRLPKKARLFTDAHRERTLVFRNRPWAHVLKDLGRRGVTAVLLEGGGKLLATAFEANCVDEIAFFIAPRILGGETLAIGARRFFGRGLAVREFLVSRLGPDVLLQGYVHRTG
ncbi:MAG TPA: bifunctional diaminohydroxyphosphoribosylaminopyrimidine deaminase/5-amino-6-(5-phosphoribosylamino)uracil reductase RibD [Verrucomicrobiae bacterium]|nr:bifunctional diaminohydroxyphosphoribosylaminopyrimidine deaminase/5-amino-6-(5-phosphoribosylamino)uracil reductase RibD [Verrucomicrobiae bacterium]